MTGQNRDPATLWDERQDGKFYADIADHCDTVRQRVRAIYGDSARAQIGSHGCDRYSVQVFGSGGALLMDRDL